MFRDILYKLGLIKSISPIPNPPDVSARWGPQGVQARSPQITPTPTAIPSVSDQDFLDAAAEGLKNYGDLPVATLSSDILREQKKYPIYKKYPFLTHAISILESGGGKNLSPRQGPHNITSWGINLPKDLWNPTSVQQVLERTISGIGQRTPAYDAFRKSEDLRDLGNVYAPPSDNPDGMGGDTYAKNLKAVMDVFESKLKEKQARNKSVVPRRYEYR